MKNRAKQYYKNINYLFTTVYKQVGGRGTWQSPKLGVLKIKTCTFQVLEELQLVIKEIKLYTFILLFIVTNCCESLTSVRFGIRRYFKNRYRAIEIWLRRFIEFWRRTAEQKYIKLVRMLEEDLICFIVNLYTPKVFHPLANQKQHLSFL